MNSGKLVTIEGISGIGKTYYFNKLRESNNSKNIIFNKEINDTQKRGINAKIFDILFSNKNRFFDNGNAKLETLLIAAKQANDEKNFIVPNINLGNIVISDRGFDTICILEGIIMSMEYNLPEEMCIYELYNSLKTFCLVPDRTILLIGNEEESIQRAEIREKEKYTLKELIILKKSFYWFNEISKKYNARFDIIDVDKLNDEEVIKKMKKNI